MAKTHKLHNALFLGSGGLGGVFACWKCHMAGKSLFDWWKHFNGAYGPVPEKYAIASKSTKYYVAVDSLERRVFDDWEKYSLKDGDDFPAGANPLVQYESPLAMSGFDCVSLLSVVLLFFFKGIIAADKIIF